MYHPFILDHLHIRHLARQAASQSSQSLYPSLFRRGLINQANLASQLPPIPNDMATNNDAIINTNVSAFSLNDDQPGNLSNASNSIEHVTDTTVDHLDTIRTPIDNAVNNNTIDDQPGNISDASTAAEYASDAETHHVGTTKVPIDKLADNQPDTLSNASTSTEHASQVSQAPDTSTDYSYSDSDSDPADKIPWIEGKGIWVQNFTLVRQFEAEKRNADLNGGGEENFSAEMVKDGEEGDLSEEMRAWIEFRFSDARREIREREWEEEIVKMGGECMDFLMSDFLFFFVFLEMRLDGC